MRINNVIYNEIDEYAKQSDSYAFRIYQWVAVNWKN